MKKMFALPACLVTLFTLWSACMTTASAASRTSGTTGSVTFTVETGKTGCALKLRADTGRIAYQEGSAAKTKTYKGYAMYTITYKKAGCKAQTAEMSGSGTTIRLDRSSAYTITVNCVWPKKFVERQARLGYSVMEKYNSLRWTDTPCWWIADASGARIL